MVIRKSVDRRRFHMRQSICKTCVSFIMALAVILGPAVWERITSIASMLLVPPISKVGG
jgi:hypothetical protein